MRVRELLARTAVRPEVTLDGLEYMATCEPLRSAAREVVGASVSAAVSATAATLCSML